MDYSWYLRSAVINSACPENAFLPNIRRLVPSNLTDFFAPANIKPDYVPFETLRAAVPLDAAHAATFEYAKRITPAFGFTHVLRCLYFALAILYNGFPSGTPGVAQISFDELNTRLAHTILLHDLSWSTIPEGLTHPAHAMTFELHGGIMAYEHLLAAAPDLDAQQLGDIVQSIVLHTSSWASGTSSANQILMFISAFFDVFGWDALGPGSFDSLLNRTTVQEIEREFPRGNFSSQVGTVIFDREFEEKPNCLLSHFPGGLDAILKRVPVGPLGESE
ncbi:hypothetical protein DFH09DRAFT_1485929 [Mycena vulgaris]|nr:hypothetical protein DFH09DRAFT_1485929 [Mycena vulgaris]